MRSLLLTLSFAFALPLSALEGGEPLSTIPGVAAERFYKSVAFVIVRNVSDKPNKLYTCMGVLISPSFVLTSGHCVTNARSISVRLFSNTSPKRYIQRDATDWVAHKLPKNGDWNTSSSDPTLMDAALILIPRAPEWNEPVELAYEYDAWRDHPARPLYNVSQDTHVMVKGMVDLRALTLNHPYRFGDGRVYKGAIVEPDEEHFPRLGCEGDSGSPIFALDDRKKVFLIGVAHGGSFTFFSVPTADGGVAHCGPFVTYQNVTYDTKSFVARAEAYLLSKNNLPPPASDISEGSAPAKSKEGPPLGSVQNTDRESGKALPRGNTTGAAMLPSPETNNSPTDDSTGPYEACTGRDTNRDTDECKLSLTLQRGNYLDQMMSMAREQMGGPYSFYSGFYDATCPASMESPQQQHVNETSVGDGITPTEISGIYGAAMWFSGNELHRYNLITPTKAYFGKVSLIKKLRLRGGLSPAFRTESGLTIVMMPSAYLEEINIRDNPLKPKMTLKKCGTIGDYIDFMRHYMNIKKSNPYLQQGLRYLNAHDLPGALLNFKKAVDVGPTWRAYYMLAKAQYGNDQYVDAFKSISAALRDAPQSGDNYELRGLINERMAAPDAAIADFRKAIELSPEASTIAGRHLENLISQAGNRR
ncbi:exported hypothetical protein [Hyphomicrobium sp. GJ21]|uniref:tetratricopeptide repeat protein n=1 Tax=Hyphomicrobium sp. GJ21 TaxID=113574 RepID=UPI000622B84D|nr:tetratricopeptide repeat protein [Hyphomicrobium sp. GJ21]CEJ84415.1 exported hypothetical protein [Hyphomicrobium sp. GJ21]